MHKGNDPNVRWIRSGLEFQLNSLAKGPPFLQPSYFRELLHNRNMGQASAPILAAQDLGLHMIESKSNVDVSIAFVGVAIRFNVHLKNNWIPSINPHLADAHGNFREGYSFLKDFDVLLRIAKAPTHPPFKVVDLDSLPLPPGMPPSGS